MGPTRRTPPKTERPGTPGQRVAEVVEVGEQEYDGDFRLEVKSTSGKSQP